MSGLSNIQYLKNAEINKTNWDHCIAGADNGLIYGYSFYLDSMAKHWDCLVMNDYEAVMPLTWNKKLGLYYLYQPFLTAQLGVFGNKITIEQVDSFLKAIPASFRYMDISLNSKNIIKESTTAFLQRSNYILDCNKPYERLYQNYRENIQRNIKKARQLGCTLQKDIDAEKVIELAVAQMKSQGNNPGENVAHLRKLYHLLHQKQMATTYAIISANNELLSSCIFFFSHNRAYYILVGNHPNSKATGASHALIDAFIQDHAGKDMLLDFEGSDIPSLAFFYSSFGAVHETYPALKINRLPFYLKWLKK